MNSQVGDEWLDLPQIVAHENGAFVCGMAENLVSCLGVKCDLVVTSPPYYNARTEYSEYQDVMDYLEKMERVFLRLSDCLMDGARICVNIVSGYGRSPYVNLGHLFCGMVQDCGYNMRGEIIWNKGASVGSSTAWGSWLSPTSPHIRDVHEMVYVFSYNGNKLERQPYHGNPDITPDEFTAWTKSVWDVRAESRKSIHPAVMPVELALRLIKLYSFPGSIVLDPFCGIGTTCVAAEHSGRQWIGIDKDESYLRHAVGRVYEYKATKELSVL